jgi:hypothetical protein
VEAASSSETIRRRIPEDSNRCSRRCDNLKMAI